LQTWQQLNFTVFYFFHPCVTPAFGNFAPLKTAWYILENSALQQHARTFFKLYTPRVGSEMQKRCSQSCWEDENFAVFLLRVRFIGDVMCAAKRPHTIACRKRYASDVRRAVAPLYAQRPSNPSYFPLRCSNLIIDFEKTAD
jgi:hypothetical protein